MQTSALTVGQFMTEDPIVIDGGLNLVDAYTRMSQYDIRHLPVYSGGHLVGLVSDRDIGHMMAVKNLDPQATTVAAICTPTPFVVVPETPLSEVVAVMAQRKFGAVLVMREGRLFGIFSVVDALRALHAVLTVSGQEESE